jgi:hypothetical protein
MYELGFIVLGVSGRLGTGTVLGIGNWDEG